MSPSALAEKPKVLAFSYPSHIGEDYMDDFRSKYELHVLDALDRKDAIPEVAKRAAEDGPFDALLIRMGTGPFECFDEELLGPLVPHCKILASASAGYDEFDVDWMTKNKMWFCNTRQAVSEATADMAIFLILAALKDTTKAEKQAREGKWRGTLPPTRDPRGLTLGIVGMGAIGRHVARKAKVFNMKIVYYNRSQLPAELEKEYSATYCKTLDELLSQSDVISLNCPLTPQTTGLIGHNEFKQMKEGVFLVNTARGAVVDEDALIEALKSGKVARAGLDVFPVEPVINPYFVASDSCILQPHLGGLTDGAWKLAELECLENIKSCLTTGVPIAPVNHLGEK